MHFTLSTWEGITIIIGLTCALLSLWDLLLTLWRTRTRQGVVYVKSASEGRFIVVIELVIRSAGSVVVSALLVTQAEVERCPKADAVITLPEDTTGQAKEPLTIAGLEQRKLSMALALALNVLIKFGHLPDEQQDFLRTLLPYLADWRLK